ncbi:MAG: hypothetical protein II748_06190 [Clostridia bacterium]|nr:hypothetical protein [Clostridia bacterium]
MYFNKTIAADKNIPSVCQMVYDKTWTIDKLFQYAAVGTSDVNVALKIAGQINSHKDDIWQSFWQEMLIRFNDEKALFYTEVMLHVKTMRGYEVDFGIIPTPMYDEQQDMLDIIFSTYTVDLGNIYNYGQLFNYVDRAVNSNGGISTVPGALRKSTEMSVEDKVNKFLSLS